MKKKRQDAQKTNELLRKLQASLLNEKRREKKPEEDAEDAEFQEKIAGMLQSITDGSKAPDKPEALSAEPQPAEPQSPRKEAPAPKKSAARSKKKAESAQKAAPAPVPDPKPAPKVQAPAKPKSEPKPKDETTLAIKPESAAVKPEKHVPEALRRLTEDNPNAPEPMPAPTPEPAPESKPEPKAEQKSMSGSEIEPEQKPERQHERKPEPMPASKPTSEPKPAPKPEPEPKKQPEPIVIVPKQPEAKPMPEPPKPMPARGPIRIVPPTTPSEQEEAVQEQKKQNPSGAKTPAAKQEKKDKTIVIGAAGAKGESAGDPIVIKPRSATPHVAEPRESEEKTASPAQPIVITPPKTPAAKADAKAETKTDARKTPSVSLPRSHQPERPWEKPQAHTPGAAQPAASAAQQTSAAAASTKEKTVPASRTAERKTSGTARKTNDVSRKTTSSTAKNGFRMPGRRPKKINRTPISALPEDEALDEALDDMVGSVPELLPMDAPEPEELTREAGAKKTSIFARRREKKKQDALESGDALELIRKKTGMSEDDIAMIFELGYDNELGRVVGYETLKKLRYEHKQKTREAEHRHFRTAFGYRGEDGAESDTRQSTLGAYAHDRKNLIWRVVLTAFCALILAFLDIPGLTGGVLDAYRSAYPWLFPAVSLCLVFGAAALSYRQLNAGLRSLFHFTPTPYSTVAILTPIALLYGLAVLFSGGSVQMQPIGFGTVCALLLTALCDTLRLAGELRCFRLASADGTKTVLDATEPRKKKLRHGERIVRIINDEIDENLYRVRKSAQVTGFFHRCNDFSSAALPFSILLGVMLGASVQCGLIGAVRADSFAAGLSSFAVTLMYTAPTPAVFLYFYPLCRANRGLSYRNAALIGEGSVTEYSQTKTMIFNDSDLYAAQKCTQISVRDGEDFRQDMKLAGILFRKMSGTMDAVGMNAGDAKDSDLPVVFLRMTDSGTEALIDNRYHLLAGNAAFLGKSGVRIPRESTDRAAKRAGNVSLMYVAIDGVLKLSYEIEYSTAPDFEAMAGILADADTVTAIQTYDPNLNEAFLRSSRGEGAPYVRVIKPGRYEQDNVQNVVDSGVLTLGRTTDIARPVCAASAIVRLRHIGYRVLCAGSVAGAVIGVLMSFHTADFSAAVPVLLPSVFRLCMDLVTALAVRVALPSGKRE